MNWNLWRREREKRGWRGKRERERQKYKKEEMNAKLRHVQTLAEHPYLCISSILEVVLTRRSGQQRLHHHCGCTQY